MFKVTIGKNGLTNSWQAPFPETTKCVHCNAESRIGFVVYESPPKKPNKPPVGPEAFVCNLYENKGGEGGDYWLHDCCAVAIYFCKGCLKTSSLYNQG